MYIDENGLAEFTRKMKDYIDSKFAPEPEPITDLTGTTWLFNSVLSQLPLSSGQYFTMNYTSNNINCEYIGINELIPDFDAPEPRVDLYLIYDNNFNPVYIDGWENEVYRTISITGGTDVTNSDLISWLQENATQII